MSDSKPGGRAHGSEPGTYVLAPAPDAVLQSRALRTQARFVDRPKGDAGTKDSADGRQKGGIAGAYAPLGTAAPAGAAPGPLAKDGKTLTLRFVLPAGPGSETLRAVGDKIAQMLERIGVRTEISKVSDASYFKDHIASGDYDLALYSWPATPYPATDAARSSPNRSRPPTGRCWSSRTTHASVRTTSTSSSTRPWRSWTRKPPVTC